MNFVADFDGFSAPLPFLFPATDESHEAKCQLVLISDEMWRIRVAFTGLVAPQTPFYSRVFVLTKQQRRENRT